MNSFLVSFLLSNLAMIQHFHLHSLTNPALRADAGWSIQGQWVRSLLQVKSKLHCVVNSPIPNYLRRWQMISKWADVTLPIMQQYHVQILPPWPDRTDAFLMTQQSSQRNLFVLSQWYWSRTWYGTSTSTSTMIRIESLTFKAWEEESTGLQKEWSEGPRCLVFFPLFLP